MSCSEYHGNFHPVPRCRALLGRRQAPAPRASSRQCEELATQGLASQGSSSTPLFCGPGPPVPRGLGRGFIVSQGQSWFPREPLGTGQSSQNTHVGCSGSRVIHW